MCFPAGGRPPEVPADLRPIAGGSGSEDVLLTSADGTAFRARLALAPGARAAVAIAPDVRGLHSFYEELVERFGSAGVHAIAFDYFGRSAGTARRPDDFAFQEHAAAARARPDLVQADLGAALAELRRRDGAARRFVLGFCMGGRVAFNAAALQEGLGGVIGFYGVTRRRDADDTDAPVDRAAAMRAPVLGLFGGGDQAIPAADVAAFGSALAAAGVRHELVTYPDAPHSFFDRSFREWQPACDDAWRRVLAFLASGDPAAR